MNLLEVKDEVIRFLITNEKIDESDFSKLKIHPELEDCRLDLIKNCLGDLEKIGFVRKLYRGGGEFSVWLLENPIGQSNQTVTIGIQCAQKISDIINRWREANNIDEQYCNIMAIDEGDLHNLCNITLLSLNEEKP